MSSSLPKLMAMFSFLTVILIIQLLHSGHFNGPPTKLRFLETKPKDEVRASSKIQLSQNISQHSQYPSIETLENLVKLHNKSRINVSSNESQWKAKKLKGHVILLTYMRSGSSFVGNVLQSNEEVCYVFEPLFTLQAVYMRSQTPLTYLRKQPHFLKESQVNEEEDKILSTFLSCNFADLDLKTLRQQHFERGRMIDYFNCVHRIWSSVKSVVKCLHHLYDECNRRSVSLVKTIRYKIKKVAKLLVDDPLLKVIYLVRDPRATVASRLKLGPDASGGPDVNSSSLLACRDMYEDLTQFLQLENKFGQRMKLVRYEDIVESPVIVFKDMYKFINVSFTEKQSEYIHNLTNQTSNTYCEYCVRSGNSSKIAHAWRHKLSLKDAQLIDENCAAVYGLLGYFPVENKEQLFDSDMKLY